MRHVLKFAMWIQSASGLSGERGSAYSLAREQSNSAQRSSISHPILTSGFARRNAATAGIAWIMSPMALKRTTRTRSGRGIASRSQPFAKIGSGPATIQEHSPYGVPSASRPQLRQKSGCGVIFGITHNLDPATVSQHFVAFGNVLASVVGAFGLDIGVNFAN